MYKSLTLGFVVDAAPFCSTLRPYTHLSFKTNSHIHHEDRQCSPLRRRNPLDSFGLPPRKTTIGARLCGACNQDLVDLVMRSNVRRAFIPPTTCIISVPLFCPSAYIPSSFVCMVRRAKTNAGQSTLVLTASSPTTCVSASPPTATSKPTATAHHGTS